MRDFSMEDVRCVRLDCYRKKQRGECDSRDFRRAANERAQFVYSRQHPDQPEPKENPRPPIQRGFSRQASWTLRQLERRFLSHQETPNDDFRVCRTEKGQRPPSLVFLFDFRKRLKNFGILLRLLILLQRIKRLSLL